MPKTPNLRVENAPASEKSVLPPAPQPVRTVAASQDANNVVVTQLSELDSYIVQRQRAQPKTLEEVQARVERIENLNRSRHRLTLPEYFEAKSYDHRPDRPFVFRWLFKEKRSIAHALNDVGWTLVNQTYFPDAPEYLFSGNGGIEVGDSLLAFMPSKRALAIRSEPGRRSQAKMSSRMTQVEHDYVLMTGNPKDEKVYQPSMGSEEHELAPTSVSGELVAGRDFTE
mgnify:CR=1 FL=1